MRVAVSFGFLLAAYLVGEASGSFGAFVAVVACGLLFSIGLTLRSAFRNK